MADDLLTSGLPCKIGAAAYNNIRLDDGHNVPEDVVRRRFIAGRNHFNHYKQLVDSWQLYDNLDIPPVLLEES